MVPQGQPNCAKQERRAVSALCMHGSRIMQAPYACQSGQRFCGLYCHCQTVEGTRWGFGSESTLPSRARSSHRAPLQVFLVSHFSVPQTVWKTNVSFACCGRVANCVGFVNSKVGCEFRACCNVVVDP